MIVIFMCQVINKYLKRMTEVTLDIETDEGKKDFIRNLKEELKDWDDPWYWNYFETKEEALKELGI